MIGQLFPEVFLVVLAPFLNLRDTVTPYPTGRSFCGGAFPGTFVPGYDQLSLRDKSHSAIRPRSMAHKRQLNWSVDMENVFRPGGTA